MPLPPAGPKGGSKIPAHMMPPPGIAPWLNNTLPTTVPRARIAPIAIPDSARLVTLVCAVKRKPSRLSSWATEIGSRAYPRPKSGSAPVARVTVLTSKARCPTLTRALVWRYTNGNRVLSHRDHKTDA